MSTSSFNRRQALAAAAALGFGPAALAQADAPVRLVVTFPPGGSTDIAARIIQPELAKRMGRTVVVDNKPGAASQLATDFVAKSAPNGNTLLVSFDTHAINPIVKSRLPYDTFKDFAAISTLTRADFMLASSGSFAPNNLKEFIAYVKANPGKVNCVTIGLGTIQHLIIEAFMDATGTEFTVVPYKGSAPANTDLLAGRMQFSLNNPAAFAELIKAGKLKGIAISGDKRKEALPNVPTFAEAGLPGYSGANWMALLAPAATPKDIIQKINAEVARAQGLPDVIQQINDQAISAFPNTVAGTEALFRTDYERYGRIIKEKNIKVDL